MTALTVLGEVFPDGQENLHEAAARALTAALATVAPRGCTLEYLQAKDSEPAHFESNLIHGAQLAAKTARLPILWQTSTAGTLLDGTLAHAPTPLCPLRPRSSIDATQVSVYVPHTLAFTHPELLGKTDAALLRRFIKRAGKHASVLLAPTHAVAELLVAELGSHLDVRVVPLAAPEVLVPSEQRAAEVLQQASVPDGPLPAELTAGLPANYMLTTAGPGDAARLEWLLTALAEHPELPPLVVLRGLDLGDATAEPAPLASSEKLSSLINEPQLRGRLHEVHVGGRPELAGALLRGATVLALPQQYCDSLYAVYAALELGVPVVHAGLPGLTEILVDSSTEAEGSAGFAREIAAITGDAATRERLSLLALDRARGYTWEQAAWQLWEIHAGL